MLTTGQLATWQVGVISHPPRAIRQSASQTIGPDRQMAKWPTRPTIGRCGHGRYRHKTKSATWLTHSTLAETIPSAGRVAIPAHLQALCEPINSQAPPPNGQVANSGHHRAIRSRAGPPNGQVANSADLRAMRSRPVQAQNNVSHLADALDTCRNHSIGRPSRDTRLFPGSL